MVDSAWRATLFLAPPGLVGVAPDQNRPGSVAFFLSVLFSERVRVMAIASRRRSRRGLDLRPAVIRLPQVEGLEDRLLTASLLSKLTSKSSAPSKSFCAPVSCAPSCSTPAFNGGSNGYGCGGISQKIECIVQKVQCVVEKVVEKVVCAVKQVVCEIKSTLSCLLSCKPSCENGTTGRESSSCGESSCGQSSCESSCESSCQSQSSCESQPSCGLIDKVFSKIESLLSCNNPCNNPCSETPEF